MELAAHTLQDILASGADAAMVVFAYLMWKLDRRLLAVELQMRSLWKRVGEVKDKINE